MDADTRHQLKQNELAEALGRLRDWNNPSTRYTLMGLLVIVVFFTGWQWFGYTNRRGAEQAWERLASFQTALANPDVAQVSAAEDGLRVLIQKSSEPALAGFARLLLAESRYKSGLAKPEERADAFGEAAGVLEQVLAGEDPPVPVEAAALFALASTRESMSVLPDADRKAELDRARELYQKLTQDARFSGSPYVELATQRLETLDDLRTPIVLVAGDRPPPPGAPEFAGPPAPGMPQITTISQTTPEQRARIREMGPPGMPQEPPTEGSQTGDTPPQPEPVPGPGPAREPVKPQEPGNTTTPEPEPQPPTPEPEPDEPTSNSDQ